MKSEGGGEVIPTMGTRRKNQVKRKRAESREEEGKRRGLNN